MFRIDDVTTNVVYIVEDENFTTGNININKLLLTSSFNGYRYTVVIPDEIYKPYTPYYSMVLDTINHGS